MAESAPIIGGHKHIARKFRAFCLLGLDHQQDQCSVVADSLLALQLPAFTPTAEKDRLRAIGCQLFFVQALA
jgi:hypothetical protein